MPNFHPISFKFCAYVNNMFMYNMHRDREFPMKTNKLAALFLELFESPSYKDYYYPEAIIIIRLALGNVCYVGD